MSVNAFQPEYHMSLVLLYITPIKSKFHLGDFVAYRRSAILLMSTKYSLFVVTALR